MFDESETAARSIVARICGSARAEARAAAAMLRSIGHLYQLRLRESGECDDWATDTSEAVAAEVAAALRISQGLATNHLYYAKAMNDQLPCVATVFAEGDLTYSMFQTLVYRTGLITDAEVLASVDAELAVGVARWPSLSRSQLTGRVDRIVARHDRDAVRRRRERAADRSIEIAAGDSGLAEIRGYLRCTDGHALEKRLDALAATVCDDDPRTHDARRSDAMGALAAGSDRLACECGQDGCAAGTRQRSGPVLIHVVAEQATIDGRSQTPGTLLGSDSLIPPEMVAELAKSARLRPLIDPADAPAESGYLPSAALRDFVRCRDLTCRFPGCDRAAVGCDVDHTIPFGDGGATQASNLKCLCRAHHLIKTFWRWRDRQLRDGTIIWTSPSGESYVTTPGSAFLFPTLCAPAAAVVVHEIPTGRCGDRTAMMPRRRRSRAQNRTARVEAERRRNREERTAARTIGEPRASAYEEPPPF
jgi:Domain of unknown function (DUF222)